MSVSVENGKGSSSLLGGLGLTQVRKAYQRKTWAYFCVNCKVEQEHLRFKEVYCDDLLVKKTSSRALVGGKNMVILRIRLEVSQLPGKHAPTCKSHLRKSSTS